MSYHQNYRVYLLNKPAGCTLENLDTTLARSPEAAAVNLAPVPGEYLVFDLNYDEVHRVAVTMVGNKV